MIEIVRKSAKINLLIIFAYGLALLFSSLVLPLEEMGLLVIFMLVSLLFLLYMNKRMKYEPILYRSPLYYYTFLIASTAAVYISGGNLSPLFPTLFILPIIYVAINFSRKGSTGLSILANAIIWLTLLQDPTLTKIDDAIIVSIIIFILPHLVGLIVKEYVVHMKKLLKTILTAQANGDKS